MFWFVHTYSEILRGESIHNIFFQNYCFKSVYIVLVRSKNWSQLRRIRLARLRNKNTFHVSRRFLMFLIDKANVSIATHFSLWSIAAALSWALFSIAISSGVWLLTVRAMTLAHRDSNSLTTLTWSPPQAKCSAVSWNKKEIHSY